MPLDSSPTSNPMLVGHANEYFGNESQFVARQIAPVFATNEQASTYIVSEAENLLSTPSNIERAPGTAYGELSMRISQDTYNCIDRGISVPVADEIRKKYRRSWDADKAAVQKGVMTVLSAREVLLAGLATGAGVTAQAMTALTGANGDTFLAEVSTELEEIRRLTGVRPNTLVINATEWEDHIKFDSQLLARIKNNGNGVLSEVTKRSLAAVLELDQVVVPMGVKNTAKDGQTVAGGEIWTAGEAYICHTPGPGAPLDAPASFRTFTWSEVATDIDVVTFREQKRKRDVHQVFCYEDVKLTGAALTRQLTGL